MKLILILTNLVLFTASQHTDGVALAIGGWGGGTSVEVATAATTCLGGRATPPIADPPTGSIEGWVAEYVDNQVWLCGGSDLNNHAECYYMELASGNAGPWTSCITVRECYRLGDDSFLLKYQLGPKEQGSNLASGKEYPASLVFNGEMVIMGGYSDGGGWTSLVEKKIAGTTAWEVMTEWTLEQGTSDFCAVQSDPNTIIIAGGNIYDNGNKCTDVVQALDVNTGTWTNLAPLPYGMSFHHCTRYDLNGDPGILLTGGCLYPCSEHTGITLFYSIAGNSWQTLSDLNHPRFGHKMTWIDGFPAVVGGYDNEEMGDIEYFDGQIWHVLPQTLTFEHWGFALPSYMPSSTVTC